MENEFYVVIPARYNSSRLPGKAILDIAGVPMIIRVVEQALQSGARTVVVATDDNRIKNVVSAAGYEVLMTSAEHQSGSDRVAEVAETMGWSEECVVVNVQGDEPLIPPDVIAQVAGILTSGHNREQEPSASAKKEPSVDKEPSAEVATLFVPIQSTEEVLDPNVVKVVTDISGRALYFSRAPVPWFRTEFDKRTKNVGAPQEWKRHVGIYAYTLRALRNYVGLPVSRLELIECLEQLRLLDNGIDILAEAACEYVPGGIDTPDDYEKICNKLGGG